MSISKITAEYSFDPPIEDEEEAIQTLAEAVADDSAWIQFIRTEDA